MDIHNHFIMRLGGTGKIYSEPYQRSGTVKVHFSTRKANPVEIKFFLFLLYTGDSTMLEK